MYRLGEVTDPPWRRQACRRCTPGAPRRSGLPVRRGVTNRRADPTIRATWSVGMYPVVVVTFPMDSARAGPRAGRRQRPPPGHDEFGIRTFGADVFERVQQHVDAPVRGPGAEEGRPARCPQQVWWRRVRGPTSSPCSMTRTGQWGANDPAPVPLCANQVRTPRRVVARLRRSRPAGRGPDLTVLVSLASDRGKGSWAIRGEGGRGRSRAYTATNAASKANRQCEKTTARGRDRIRGAPSTIQASTSCAARSGPRIRRTARERTSLIGRVPGGQHRTDGEPIGVKRVRGRVRSIARPAGRRRRVPGPAAHRTGTAPPDGRIPEYCRTGHAGTTSVSFAGRGGVSSRAEHGPPADGDEYPLSPPWWRRAVISTPWSG